MMHKTRIWKATAAESAEDLADRLTNASWTLCTAFELQGFLFLNDATSEDGAQEYAVVTRATESSGEYRQVESITFSWCSESEALGYINGIIGGAKPIQPVKIHGGVVVAGSLGEVMQFFGTSNKSFVVQPTIESPDEHDTCYNCA